MLSPSCLILNIWPEAGCEVMISSEIFGSVLVIIIRCSVQRTKAVQFSGMVIFPTCSVTFPRHQRERGPSSELSAACSEQNESGSFGVNLDNDDQWMFSCELIGSSCGSMRHSES